MRRRVCRPPGFRAYLMPGFGLAKKAIEIFEQAQPSDGLILSKHGIATFGESAHEAYERMIAMVSLPKVLLCEQRAPHSRNTMAIARADRSGRANHPWRLQPKG